MKHSHSLTRLAAAAVLATTLLGTTASHAGLVVTAATRSVSADTEGASPGFDSSSATSGDYGAFRLSQVALDTGDGALTLATQDSAITVANVAVGGIPIGTPVISGDIGTRVERLNGRSGVARSVADFFFTLTTTFTLEGSVSFTSRDLIDITDSSFVLERVGAGAGVIVAGNDDDVPGDSANEVVNLASTTLAAGDYHLGFVAEAAGSGLANDDVSFGSLRFRAFFIDQGGAPGAVPAPSSLALSLAGVLAAGALRRPTAAPHQPVSR